MEIKIRLERIVELSSDKALITLIDHKVIRNEEIDIKWIFDYGFPSNLNPLHIISENFHKFKSSDHSRQLSS